MLKMNPKAQAAHYVRQYKTCRYEAHKECVALDKLIAEQGWTHREAAKYAQCSASTISYMRRDAKIPVEQYVAGRTTQKTETRIRLEKLPKTSIDDLIEQRDYWKDKCGKLEKENAALRKTLARYESARFSFDARS